MQTIEKALKKYEYPGRGIVVGKTPDNNRCFIAYFIMGRSPNSKNRIFELDEEKNLLTRPFKKEKLKNEDLIIYKATAEFENKIIITNGDHTTTILEGLKKNQNFEECLKTRKFEEDFPILTPRISAIVTLCEENLNYCFSIIKSNQKKENSVCRFFFYYENVEKSQGHLIHTYKKKENDETNSFFGEPENLIIPQSFEDFSSSIWNSLNEEKKISLFTSSINLKTKEKETKIFNKNL